MTGSYQLEPYTWDNLVTLFSFVPNIDRGDYVSGKPQIAYLDYYCEKAGVQSLILVAPYVDRHYSEDYWGYYVKCHSEYPKTCARLHFFKAAIDPSAVEAFLKNGEGLDFNDFGYCGFVVVKPLPETVVGRTCLTPLPVVDGGTSAGSFFLTRSGYRPHLFGVDLRVSALPFQEQDHEVGACATSAMWTALHGTANAFGTPILSPLQITQRAAAKRPVLSVSLPSDGLTLEQLASVFRDVGLEADHISAEQKYVLQSASAAYLRAHIPVILTFRFETSELHGVTLTGIGPMDGPLTPLSETGFLLRATRIQRIYAHDDGVGPYSDLTIDAKSKHVITSWLDENGNREKAAADVLLVPLSHTLRVQFPEILAAVQDFDWVVEQSKHKYKRSLFERPEWDIFLSTACDFKKSILMHNGITKSDRKKMLMQGFPHFIWRAIAYADGSPAFEMLFDSSDLRQGRQLITTLIYNLKFSAKLGTLCKRALYLRNSVSALTHTMLREMSTISK